MRGEDAIEKKWKGSRPWVQSMAEVKLPASKKNAGRWEDVWLGKVVLDVDD